ncbi:hypothetical protein [Nonomuraea sp. NPDC049309]|uniref:hypothetical protein n=1 Tax=Nonomuraea sp. NPDC049309 TaxID=3364350 RepID=UPI00371F18E4
MRSSSSRLIRLAALPCLVAAVVLGLLAPAATAAAKAKSTIRWTLPASPTALDAFTLTGRLNLPGLETTGPRQIVISRGLPGGEQTPIAEVTTADDGTFSVTDAPPVGGFLFYSARWAGDDLFFGSARTIEVPVYHRRSGFVFSGPAQAVAGQPFEISVRLDGSGHVPTSNPTVWVYRAIDDLPVASLGTVTVADDGTFAITDTPEIAGQYSYRLKWGGDATFSAAIGSHAVTVTEPAG